MNILYIALFLQSFGMSILVNSGVNPVNVAVEFLNSLDANQLDQVLYDFDDSSREALHYFPASMIPRAGMRVDKLDDKQAELFQNLLQSFLSEAGYRKTLEIIDLENVLAELTGDLVMRDAGGYHIAFYGNPEKDENWSWSYEGHHLSLNFTMAGDKISMVPRFLGANPAIIPIGPKKGECTLCREENLGIELVNSLSSEQSKAAFILPRTFDDIVSSFSSRVEVLQPVGIRLNDLDPSQQRILLDLIAEYLSSMPFELAKKRSDQLMQEEFEEIRFAWAGATKLGRSHYYRVQGKTFLIEFDNTQNNANHIHSVWREFEGDFGRDLLREHYSKDHRH